MLAAEGHNVYGVIRKQSQIPDIEGLGGKPVVQSIEDSTVDDMAKNYHRHKSDYRNLECWCRPW